MINELLIVLSRRDVVARRTFDAGIERIAAGMLGATAAWALPVSTWGSLASACS
jgi:hypothetical protein